MKIAIASCADYRNVASYSVWKQIEQHQPDLLLLLGDNIYLPQPVNPENQPELRAALDQQYFRLVSDPYFKSLKTFMSQNSRRVAAIIDDHDSIGEDTKHPVFTETMRKTAHASFFQNLPFAALGETIYGTFVSGNVRVILLDGRSYREEDASTLDEVLGTVQAKWFRLETAAITQAKYTVVCSGFTLHWYELVQSAGWFRHGGARKELCAALRNRPGYLFLSGDIHDNRKKMKDGVIEIVSSGVARKSLGGGDDLANYGILEFGEDGVRVQLLGIQSHQLWDHTIAYDDWRV